MLFGQAPCSRGRMKHRRVNYLALLGPVTNGQCDITTSYVARFGEPLAKVARIAAELERRPSLSHGEPFGHN
jgi:hypothetical protein